MATHAPRTPASLSLSPRSIAASHRAAVAAPQATLSELMRSDAPLQRAMMRLA